MKKRRINEGFIQPHAIKSLTTTNSQDESGNIEWKKIHEIVCKLHYTWVVRVLTQNRNFFWNPTQNTTSFSIHHEKQLCKKRVKFLVKFHNFTFAWLCFKKTLFNVNNFFPRREISREIMRKTQSFLFFFNSLLFALL